MNYIFIDVDGPLLPGKMRLFLENQGLHRRDLKGTKPTFDPFAVRCFNLWAKYGNTKAVFSTNWTSSLDSLDSAISYLKETMENNGLELDYHNEIVTPKKFTSQRGSEIWWWLNANAKDGDKFLAVDDDSSCRYIEDYIRPRENDCVNNRPLISGKWIEVDYKNGLTLQNFWDGCEVFGITADEINEGEFGIKPLTDEEKQKREDALDLLARYLV